MKSVWRFLPAMKVDLLFETGQGHTQTQKEIKTNFFDEPIHTIILNKMLANQFQ
jgi:hypothetical protein